MVEVLENKRAATRFRILVAIAERQPAVSQGEIAEAVGVTSQAVSEYTRDLVEEGFVAKEGRSNYRVTKEGVDWMLQASTAVRQYVDRVTEDILGSVQEDAAIASTPIERGDTLTLTIVDGLLHAAADGEGGARGEATMDAEVGEDVGVTGFEGIIDLEAAAATVLQVPTIRSGGSRRVDPDDLGDRCASAEIVGAAGVEAVVACRKAGVEPDTTFAADAVVAEAAGRGLEGVVVATSDAIGRVTDTLRDADVAYELVDLG